MSIKIKKRTKSKKRSWSSNPRYWVAMGTLATYTTVGTHSKSALAYAQDKNRSAADQPGASLVVRRFEISPGPLDVALNSFERAVGWRIEVSKEGIRTLASPGVTGLYTPEKALKLLLAGTGVNYRITGSDAVALDIEELKTTIEVSAEGSALSVTMPKYSEPALDTPQTISTVPQQVMKDQGTTTLRDAVRNVAGISLAAGEGGAQGDNLTIRGFSARNDLFIDGMRDYGSYYRDPFNTEELEILQGPSSVTFGRGSTGGVVNQATKTPRPDRFISGGVDFGTDRTRRITLDIDQPLKALGSGTAFRLNLMGTDAEVAERDVARNRRFGAAPSLAFGLGSDTRLSLNYFHQQADDIPDYGIPWLFNGPAPVDRNNFYGFRHGNYLKTTDDIGTARVDHEINAHVTIRSQARYANYLRKAVITEARLPTDLTPRTPLDQITVTRNHLAVDSAETFLQNQTDITAKFETGPFKHSLAAGVEGGRETSDPTRFAYAGVPTTNLLHPDTNQAFTGIPTVSSNVKATAIGVATYVLDTVQIGKKWLVTGGIRWDRFDTTYSQAVAPIASFQRVDQMPAWRAAVVYKPVQIGSIYASYGTSFNPSAESLSLSAANANLPPEKNKTYEVGSKWDLRGGRLSLRTALFRTEKTNAREPDPNNSLLNVLAGTQRVDGVELEARGRLTSRWEIMSGYAHLDAKVVKSISFPTAIGAQLANVPANTFTFWNQYRLPWQLEAGLGANCVSSRPASSTAPFDPVTGLVKALPGYWVFNAMAKHPLNDHIDLQVNVYNLANRYYYDQLHPAHIVLGAGRSALIGIKFKF
jgi:catecholate siderophore receptor